MTLTQSTPKYCWQTIFRKKEPATQVSRSRGINAMFYCEGGGVPLVSSYFSGSSAEVLPHFKTDSCPARLDII